MQTIRSRLTFVFIICFLFTAGLTALDYYHLFVLQKKIRIIEEFDDFKNDVLELRRYEKNYYLTGKSVHIGQMRQYLAAAEALFHQLKDQMQEVLGPARYQACSLAFATYHDILGQTEAHTDAMSRPPDSLRSNGKVLTEFSEMLIKEKRRRLKSALENLLPLPLAFSLAFILLVLAVMHMTRQDIFNPLRKIQSAAEEVGKGAFQPIADTSTKQNEVYQCITAFNNMITEIDTRQEQLLQSRKMASIGIFTSGIAHELNNPINNISLVVESLMEDEDSLSGEERRHLYQDLMDQAERASDIVRNLLEFSRTDRGHLESISIREMVERTRRLIQNELKLNKVRFHAEVPEDLPKAKIDKSRLQQALINLLVNGIQAMPDGGDLTLAAVADPDFPSAIRIDVRDTGVGIPAEQLDSVFDPFYTTKKEGEGTGLGLSVTYNIIKYHHGRITVESAPDKGTCFSIFLPVHSETV